MATTNKRYYALACLLFGLCLVLTLCGLAGCQPADTSVGTLPDTDGDTGATDTPPEPTGTAQPDVTSEPAGPGTDAEPVSRADTDADTDVDDSTQPPEEMTMEQTAGLAIITAGNTDYTILQPDNLTEQNRRDIAWLCEVLEQTTGVTLTVSDKTEGHVLSFDYYPDGSANALNRSIAVDGETGLISIRGGSEAALSAAIRYFATQYVTQDGQLTVDAAGYTYDYDRDRIDNSDLLTYKKADADSLAYCDDKNTVRSPDWLDTAVMVEVRMDKASIGGGFAESYDLIDFYASTGVNCLWLVPIYERGAGGNGYGNIGLHTVEPWLTGTDDMNEGWEVVRKFTDYAHSKGVYILLDIVSWGTMKSAPLIEEHPDWFSGEAWGNAAFNWGNDEFREWFINTAVENIEKSGADGYRCDCEPFTAGYDVYAQIRERLNQKGIYPVIMSEDGGERRSAFDCEQDGVLDYKSMSRGQLYQQPVNFFVDGYLDIVRNTRTGTGLGAAGLQNRRSAGAYKYYTNCITNHDYQRRDVCGNRLRIGYAAIYAPYIPLWYMGDEFGAEATNVVLYDRAVDFSQPQTDAKSGIFYEDVKQMIRIRRTYDDLFAYWPLCHRDTNICAVTVEGLDGLTNYARYGEGRMILVVANHGDTAGVATVRIPLDGVANFARDGANYRVTDLLTGRVICVGWAATVENFTCVVPQEYCGVYLVERVD